MLHHDKHSMRGPKPDPAIRAKDVADKATRNLPPIQFFEAWQRAYHEALLEFSSEQEQANDDRL